MLARNNWYEDKTGEKEGTGLKDGKRRKMDMKDGRDVPTSTVVFVPPSKGGKLLGMLKDKEDELARITKFRVRYQEAGGTKLGLMFSTDLGAGEGCGRNDCQPCGSRKEKRPNCKARSILYESKCNICNTDVASSHQEGSANSQAGRKGIYIGETSRSLYERSREHMKDAEDFSHGSHIVKHWINEHAESESCPGFTFSILGNFRDCLSRQVAEAIRILYTKDQILNSKNEYMANCLSRVCVEEDKYARKKRERLEEQHEEEEKQLLEAFKAKYKRKKRARPSLQDYLNNSPEEPAGKRRRLEPFLKDGSGEDELDIGAWLEKAEMRCLRVGQLRSRLERERCEVLQKMANLGKPSIQKQTQNQNNSLQEEDLVSTLAPDGNLQEGLHSQGLDVQRDGLHSQPAVGQHHGGLHSQGLDVQRDGLHSQPAVGQHHGGLHSQGLDVQRDGLHSQPTGGQHHEARRKKKTGYCLTSLAAWWTRVEREEVKFMKGVVRENMIRDKKRIENVKVREKKENFVKKFFPTCANSPGGRQYITGVSPARKRAMEKIQNDEDIRTSAKRKLSSNIHFGLGQAKVKKKRTSYQIIW